MSTLAASLDALPLPAILVRRDEWIEAANDKARALFGDWIADRHFITALRQPVLLDAVETCLRDHSPQEVELLINDVRRDSVFQATVRPVEASDGPGALVCLIDQSDLRQASEMRRDFVANVSHELRTPLTALLGFIETLSGPASKDDAARVRFLDIMRQEAERMNRLVGDLLSLSRVEADGRVRPTSPVELCGLVRSSIHGLERLAKEKDITLCADLPDSEVVIPGDKDQLRQVLNNLCENAIKYSDQGDSVTVSLTLPGYERRLRGDGVSLAVQDTGPGIDPLHIPRLTERFYRVDDHRSRAMGGTGLGLAIVKHIVTRHRGRLRIESTPGQGTLFTVLLPAS